MKQGISIERTYDLHDRLVVRILKRRGRLTLEEVSDLLRLEGGGEWSGWYAVLLNCTEGTIGGNGLYDSEDPKGDAIDLYEINEGDDCPICGKFIPPFQYCPSCGAKWSDAYRGYGGLRPACYLDADLLISIEDDEATDDVTPEHAGEIIAALAEQFGGTFATEDQLTTALSFMLGTLRATREKEARHE